MPEVFFPFILFIFFIFYFSLFIILFFLWQSCNNRDRDCTLVFRSKRPRSWLCRSQSQPCHENKKKPSGTQDSLVHCMIPRRINTVIQDFESCERMDYKRDLNTCHILDHFITSIPTFWQICVKFHPCNLSFRRIETIFCRNIV